MTKGIWQKHGDNWLYLGEDGKTALMELPNPTPPRQYSNPIPYIPATPYIDSLTKPKRQTRLDRPRSLSNLLGVKEDV